MKPKKIKSKLYSKNNKDNFDFLKLQYQVLSNRQVNHNSLLWNTPSLLFVAQAFLWTISLDNEVSPIIRCCISLSSILIGFASLQGFVRNRFLEIADSEQLYAIEKRMAGEQYPAMIVHHKMERCTIISDEGTFSLEAALRDRRAFLARFRSFSVWRFVFWVALGLAVVLFFYNLYCAVKAYWGIDLIAQFLPQMRAALSGS